MWFAIKKTIIFIVGLLCISCVTLALFFADGYFLVTKMQKEKCVTRKLNHDFLPELPSKDGRSRYFYYKKGLSFYYGNRCYRSHQNCYFFNVRLKPSDQKSWIEAIKKKEKTFYDSFACQYNGTDVSIMVRFLFLYPYNGSQDNILNLYDIFDVKIHGEENGELDIIWD